MEQLKTSLETLYAFNRCLLGEGYDNALKFIDHLIGIETISIDSGTRVGDWTVPDEWVVRGATLKFNGKVIWDYRKNPLGLVVGSIPFKGKVTLEELKQHLHRPNDNEKDTPYVYKFYEKDWGLCFPTKEFDEGEYEVDIDTEYRKGKMNIGVHTIKGEGWECSPSEGSYGSEEYWGRKHREILLFAHLDHPHQANDNLSGVACLLNLVKKLKAKHTIKLIFCPETIGSIAYCETQDISKVDAVIAVDICGNENSLLLQKTFQEDTRLDRAAHCVMQLLGKVYRKAKFRNVIGSDEYYFNDPKVNIPAILLTRFPYDQYHLSSDTPDIINYEKISETADAIVKIIEVYEKDYIPERVHKGPIMRSKCGMQSPFKQLNLNYDYLFYSIDGKRSLAELCAAFELNFDEIYEKFNKLIENETIRRIDVGKI